MRRQSRVETRNAPLQKNGVNDDNLRGIVAQGAVRVAKNAERDDRVVRDGNFSGEPGNCPIGNATQ